MLVVTIASAVAALIMIIIVIIIIITMMGFLDGSEGKESARSAGDPGSIPGSERCPGEGNGNPLQYSCLENPHGQRSLAGYSPWGLQIVQPD